MTKKTFSVHTSYLDRISLFANLYSQSLILFPAWGLSFKARKTLQKYDLKKYKIKLLMLLKGCKTQTPA